MVLSHIAGQWITRLSVSCLSSFPLFPSVNLIRRRFQQFRDLRLRHVFLGHERDAGVDPLLDFLPLEMINHGHHTEITHLHRVLHDEALNIAVAAGGVLLAQNAAHALVAGTVFRENGFSLAGATVTLIAKNTGNDTGNDTGKAAAKRKPLRAISDARGEFTFRVSPVPGTYMVKATMKGFQAVEAETSVGGEERVDVTLILTPESK